MLFCNDLAWCEGPDEAIAMYAALPFILKLNGADDGWNPRRNYDRDTIGFVSVILSADCGRRASRLGLSISGTVW